MASNNNNTTTSFMINGMLYVASSPQKRERSEEEEGGASALSLSTLALHSQEKYDNEENGDSLSNNNTNNNNNKMQRTGSVSSSFPPLLDVKDSNNNNDRSENESFHQLQSKIIPSCMFEDGLEAIVGVNNNDQYTFSPKRFIHAEDGACGVLRFVERKSDGEEFLAKEIMEIKNPSRQQHPARVFSFQPRSVQALFEAKKIQVIQQGTKSYSLPARAPIETRRSSSSCSCGQGCAFANNKNNNKNTSIIPYDDFTIDHVTFFATSSSSFKKEYFAAYKDAGDNDRYKPLNLPMCIKLFGLKLGATNSEQASSSHLHQPTDWIDYQTNLSRKTEEIFALREIQQQQQVNSYCCFLSNGGVVRLTDVCLRVYESHLRVFIIMPVASEGDALDAFLAKQICQTEETLKVFFRKIASGLATMHRAGFAHRDLKLDNIVVSRPRISTTTTTPFSPAAMSPSSSSFSSPSQDLVSVAQVLSFNNIDNSNSNSNNNTIPSSPPLDSVNSPSSKKQQVEEERLAVAWVDLGFATNNEHSADCVGSEPTRAPETFLSTMYNTKKADIWSLGVILLQMVMKGCVYFLNPHHQKVPFLNARRTDRGFMLLSLGRAQMDGSIIGAEIGDLISMMLRINPCDRPSIEQVLNHPWLRSN